MIQPTSILRGVWQAPPNSAAKWAARGCNAFVDLQQGADRKATLDACAAAGIKMLIEPGPILANDIHHPGFLGWIQKPDEPENDEHVQIKDAAGRRDYMFVARTWRTRYAQLKAAAPNVPIFSNFNGMILTASRESWAGTGKPPAEQNITWAEYRALMSASDIDCADWHVINSGRGAAKIIDLYTKMMGRLLDFGGGKPAMAVIECAYEHRVENGPGPTGAEIRAQVWASLILGGMGVVYFPAKIGGGYVADNMNQEQVDAMSATNDEIRRAEPWLLAAKRTFTAISGGITAMWVNSSGDTVRASVVWDGMQIKTNVTIPDAPIVDPELTTLRAENKRLRDRLERIDTWRGGYPAN